MTSEMRLGKERESAHAARWPKLVPGDFSQNVKIQIAYDPVKQRTQAGKVSKGRRITSDRINHPFCAENHIECM